MNNEIPLPEEIKSFTDQRAMDELALVEDPHTTFQEWLDTNPEELTDYQREFVERYVNFVDHPDGLDEVVVEPIQELDFGPKPVGHQITYDPHHQLGNAVVCTCGWKKVHARGKILVRSTMKHTLKTGHEFKALE